jgi:hypothetical protein
MNIHVALVTGPVDVVRLTRQYQIVPLGPGAGSANWWVEKQFGSAEEHKRLSLAASCANVGVVESCHVTVVVSGRSHVTCQENVVGEDGLIVDAFCGVISVMEGAAASAGGADASSTADSTAAARAARGMWSSHRTGGASLPMPRSGNQVPGCRGSRRGQGSDGWQNGRGED